MRMAVLIAFTSGQSICDYFKYRRNTILKKCREVVKQTHR